MFIGMVVGDSFHTTVEASFTICSLINYVQVVSLRPVLHIQTFLCMFAQHALELKYSLPNTLRASKR